MRPNERDAAALQDMLEALSLAGLIVGNMSFAAYQADRIRQLALERSLEIIGEAAKSISAEFRAAHDEIPWKSIVALRNVIAHEYGEIKQERIWRVAVEFVPGLRAQIEDWLELR